MRALIITTAGFLFLGSCSKSASPVPAPARLTTWTVQIDRLLIEIENVRKAGQPRYNQPAQRNEPLTVASDAVFLRRAFLDTIGRIPAVDEARSFLADKAPDKRARLIDRLLADPGWAEQRFQQLASLFRVQDEVLGVSQKPYIDWLRAAAGRNLPFDELARTLLTASGNLQTNPATGYLLRDHGWMTATATETAWAFLGADLVCAHCHDHPFTDWTQRQVYQLAACFGSTSISGPSGELWPATKTPAREQRLRRETPLTAGTRLEIADAQGGGLALPSNYKYRDGAPGTLVAPDVLPLERRDAQNAARSRILASPADGRSLRAAFAEWVVTHEQFAQTFAQRAWNQLFVEPRPATGAEPLWDAIQAAPAERSSLTGMVCNTGCGAGPNPQRWSFEVPPNDEQLQKMIRLLAGIAREVRFDAREMQRVLMNTWAYQRSAITLPMGEPTLFRPAPLLRRMSAGQMWDSLVTLGGVTHSTRELPQTPPLRHPLKILGRGQRDWPDDDTAPVSFALTRWMFNGQPVEQAALKTGRMMKQPDDLFLAILGRPPSAAELAAAEKQLGGDDNGPASIAWALLNTGEFLFVQ